MGRSTATRHRQPGSLRRVSKTARGRKYERWQWRTHRQTDTGWATVDVELGERLTGLRTRTLIALGELSAPLLVERWARWHFRSWNDMPAFTGRPAGAKQRSAWWCELPRQSDGSIRIRFRSVDGSYDFRRRGARSAITSAEELATSLWRCLTADPIVELGRLQWFESEAQTQIEKIAEEQLELRRQRRVGDLSQRDFEADERDTYLRLERWEAMQAAVRTRWDELLAEMVAALPRTRRDELKPRIVMQADRLQSDSKQLQKWRDDHWVDNTLEWRV
ncbi:hypothetical protein KR100_00280 [Synechococcus sp. KORDI-100]|uniref:hypothetical protein n=1 Tax=Synechococcus sp. KORDI-100 TaxID=1280380 RepID=UPI0004E039C2|nr:hypothetical protein [Synechococcus sp. KORDI-100]AII41846.1 hypothetical protein KR100_00280 [Synechococcus sp. KORDI-100]